MAHDSVQWDNSMKFKFHEKKNKEHTVYLSIQWLLKDYERDDW
jgi:hypothetical protein